MSGLVAGAALATRPPLETSTAAIRSIGTNFRCKFCVTELGTETRDIYGHPKEGKGPHASLKWDRNPVCQLEFLRPDNHAIYKLCSTHVKPGLNSSWQSSRAERSTYLAPFCSRPLLNEPPPFLGLNIRIPSSWEGI